MLAPGLNAALHTHVIFKFADFTSTRWESSGVAKRELPGKIWGSPGQAGGAWRGAGTQQQELLCHVSMQDPSPRDPSPRGPLCWLGACSEA